MTTFATKEEAEEINSDCSFCKLPKFDLLFVSNADLPHYVLERCSLKDCDLHCRWGHHLEPIFIDFQNEDHIDMIS